MRNIARKIAVTAATLGAIAVPMVAGGTANASTGTAHASVNSDCTVGIFLSWHNGHQWAQAAAHARAGLPSNRSCTFFLERDGRFLTSPLTVHAGQTVNSARVFDGNGLTADAKIMEWSSGNFDGEAWTASY